MPELVAVMLRAAAALSICSGLGCSARGDIPEVVLTQSDVGFDGVPRIPGVPSATGTLRTSFDHPKGFDLPEFFNPELYPLSASITGLGDMRDLTFVEGLTLTLSSRAEDGPPPRVMATYERGSGGAVGRVVEMDTDGDSDVLTYWSTQSAFYDITIWGDLPEQAWAIDVNVAFSGSISVSSSD
jgi:hypothetical protein